MVKSYTLRSAYSGEGILVGGSVKAGADGEMLDIIDALKEGNGEIVTDNPVLQSSLDGFFGNDGLVFEAKEVQGDQRIPLPPELTPHEIHNAGPTAEQIEAGQVPGTNPEEPPSSNEGDVENEGSGGDNEEDPTQAQHGDESEYAQFTMDELRSTLQERNVQFNARANKAELIAALEQDDLEREGAGSGS